MSTEETRESLLALRFVGPATADVLADAGVDAADVESKSVSHADLVDAGVNPGVAARIRREHSLQWSFEGGQDLDRRAEQVRGLQDDEREWVAASYGETDAASTDGSGDEVAAEAAWQDRQSSGSDDEAAVEREEADWQRRSWPREDDDADAAVSGEVAWRERSKPTPLTALDEVDGDEAELLASAGITSVRSLATANADRVADSLGIPTERVEAWQDAADARR